MHVARLEARAVHAVDVSAWPRAVLSRGTRCLFGVRDRAGFAAAGRRQACARFARQRGSVFSGFQERDCFSSRGGVLCGRDALVRGGVAAGYR